LLLLCLFHYQRGYCLLGKLLKKVRKQNNLTQSDLAKQAGLSIPTIALIECDRGGTLTSLLAIATRLGLNPSGFNLPPGNTLGQRLAGLRKKKQMTQKNVADLTHITRATLIALEKNNKGQLRAVYAIANCLGTRLFLEEKNQPKAFYAHTALSSADSTWTTPPDLLEKLYKLIPVFDLDPCSPTTEKKLAPVKAKNYYTEILNGLEFEWHGHVFLNPPYGRTIQSWIEKAQTEFSAGRATSIIGLIPARPDTRWWQKHIPQTTVALLQGRLKFGGQNVPAPFPSALVLWSDNPLLITDFTQLFQDQAWIIPKT